MSSSYWEKVASQGNPSWYLDPLVARQKAAEHRAVLRRAAKALELRTLLKTDLFEEAFGEDQILFGLDWPEVQAVGIDTAPAIVERARRRWKGGHCLFAAADVRQLPFPSGHFDLVFSNSTLDHSDDIGDIRRSIIELTRITRPGGLIVVTLDNPWNPFYWLLRWCSRLRWTPFHLGRTLSWRELNACLADCGLEIVRNDWLIHNPRLLSTGIFLLLRKLLGRRADGPIGLLLACFALGDRLPTRRFTACFVAATARRVSTT